MKDYYSVLGVAKDASDVDIKKAYKKMAFECHPDRNLGNKEAEEKFKDINEAYSTLSDKDKRRRYDSGGNSFQGVGFDPFSFFESQFGDFFGQRRSNVPQAATPIHLTTPITLEEAALGGEKTIEFDRNIRCSSCLGTRAKDGSSLKVCGSCGGNGKIINKQGYATTIYPCHVCSGSGKVPDELCSVCSGVGHSKDKTVLSIKIPPSIDTGATLRIPGKGNIINDNIPPGDVFIQVIVSPHNKFNRFGYNIYHDVKVKFTDAVLGAEVLVPTIDGEEEKISIPSGTQQGEEIYINGKGVIKRDGARGDQVVRVFIDVPKNLNEVQLKLINKLSKVL
jgi:molecular chaperone DnaJ